MILWRRRLDLWAVTVPRPHLVPLPSGKLKQSKSLQWYPPYAHAPPATPQGGHYKHVMVQLSHTSMAHYILCRAAAVDMDSLRDLYVGALEDSKYDSATLQGVHTLEDKAVATLDPR